MRVHPAFIGVHLRQGFCLFLAAALTAQSPNTRPITFDLSAGHPFLGLATVIWPAAPFAAERHNVMVATQMNWARIPLMNSFFEGDEKPGMSVKEILAQRNNHPVRAAAEHLSPQQLKSLHEEDLKTADHYRALGEELRAADIHLIIAAVPNFPKDWMKTIQYKGVEYKLFLGGKAGEPDHRQDYITLIVAEIIAAREAGLAVAGIELPFEPDGPTAGMRPDIANTMVGKLRKT